MIFVPHIARHSYIDPEELARAIWDEKERREEEARRKAEKEREEAQEKAYYDSLAHELGEALARGEEI